MGAQNNRQAKTNPKFGSLIELRDEARKKTVSRDIFKMVQGNI